MLLVLRNQSARDRACEIINQFNDDKIMQVEIREWSENRSLAQNRLYQVFVTQIAGERGMTKDEVKHDLKGRFLSKIYERDNQSYAEMMEAIREVHRSGAKELAITMKRGTIRMTSTRDATMKQFSEFLDCTDKFCISIGIYLERPEDMYREAMGR